MNIKTEIICFDLARQLHALNAISIPHYCFVWFRTKFKTCQYKYKDWGEWGVINADNTDLKRTYVYTETIPAYTFNELLGILPDDITFKRTHIKDKLGWTLTCKGSVSADYTIQNAAAKLLLEVKK